AEMARHEERELSRLAREPEERLRGRNARRDEALGGAEAPLGAAPLPPPREPGAQARLSELLHDHLGYAARRLERGAVEVVPAPVERGAGRGVEQAPRGGAGVDERLLRLAAEAVDLERLCRHISRISKLAWWSFASPWT